ncbi:MAG: metallophosphoesterase [Dysgonamonadaceae bacterium]|jgi:predicted MPP superfamily phosphohydrolase|nr:metallophosphoesterase [Dysgonamonadaceae bacterium]
MFGFFVFIFAVYAVFNLYVIRKLMKSLPQRPSLLKSAVLAVFIFLFAAFPLAMLLRNLLPLPVLKALYMPGTFWLAVMMYLLVYLVVTDILFLLLRLFGAIPKNSRAKWSSVRVSIGVVFIAGLLIYGYWNFTHPVVVERVIEIDKPAGKFSELKVVAVSDLHLGANIDRARLTKYVDLINAQNPDIVLIAGDIVDNSARPLNEERMEEEINRINAHLGVYFCLGNHEYLSGIEESLDFLKKTKMHLLIDDNVLIDSSLYVIGRDDSKLNPDRKTLQELVAAANLDLPLILLDHEPYGLEEAAQCGIDLQISGHTHNGQIWPGNLIAAAIFELPYGFAKKGSTNYCVSSGLGLWGPMLRIGTQSEIVVIRLKFKN